MRLEEQVKRNDRRLSRLKCFIDTCEKLDQKDRLTFEHDDNQ